MRYSFYFIIVTLAFNGAGCKKVPEPSLVNGRAYYRFESSDKARLLTYKEDDTILFKNQYGVRKQFEIVNYRPLSQHLFGQGVGFFGPNAATYFYYDETSMTFNGIGEYFTFDMSFRRWPLNMDSAMDNVAVVFPSKMFIQIDFPRWNGLDRDMKTRNRSVLVPDGPQTTLRIDQVIYNNVVKIVSNNTDTASRFGNTNIIYFAYKFGVIGFDEVDGTQWRIQK